VTATPRTTGIEQLAEGLAFEGVAIDDPGEVPVYERLRSTYDFEARGAVEIMGKGRLQTHLLSGRRLPQAA
jgi:hypothetical protein